MKYGICLGRGGRRGAVVGKGCTCTHYDLFSKGGTDATKGGGEKRVRKEMGKGGEWDGGEDRRRNDTCGRW